MDRGAQIAAAGDAARLVLAAKHEAREVTLAASRRTIQACAAAIRAVHRGEYDAANAQIGIARDALGEAEAVLGGHDDVRHAGYLHDAQKEFVEAHLTLAFATDAPLPAVGALGVPVQTYLKGMCGAASELRREALADLRRGDVARAERLLATMDEVYGVLVTIDYPDALTGGLRRSTDALRAVLERTRGDLTTTMVANRLQASIEQAAASIES